MIFVTVGSQKFQFDRLLKEIDRLVEEQKVKPDEVFAQIGYSTYEPRLYSYKKFLNKEEFLNLMKKSEIIITHGGTGSIINGVKQEKKVIGIPRTVKYGEHVDNHQFEIIEQFTNSNLIYGISDIEELEHSLETVKNMQFKKYQSNTNNIINILDAFLKKTI
ncbi:MULTISPECIES: PssE/Cps14G family polysaccharide biosynthesis glycosyltransferase [Bacillus]|uniref:PssE/Cps14G family polysaccharide biosynthesis glycosyltransferase n=1 Tax=Bacillus TaxID=1386 RepID=UPI001912B752|nr:MULTISPECIES: PssE/Cps14G family polysaccharide biosynthesis glycosyltransferase [Bacillus]MBK5470007.1 beta(1,3)galactosyltransferase EpsH [Bacillus sp. TH19]WOA57412.1 PssE/Cps14G family polysaccharide biosynthesis glycosyltransferase [Bacillus mycoides]